MRTLRFRLRRLRRRRQWSRTSHRGWPSSCERAGPDDGGADPRRRLRAAVFERRGDCRADVVAGDGSRSAFSSSAAGPVGLPVRSGSASCSRSTRTARAPRRRTGRAGREGQAARLASALGRRHQPACAAPAVQGQPRPACRDPHLRRGTRGGRLPDDGSRALRIPPPPTMRNHGNWIVSIVQLARYLAEQAELGGTYVLPETSAQTLLVEHGRVAGVRTGDKGRARTGSRSPTSSPARRSWRESPCSPRAARAISRLLRSTASGCAAVKPQLWELGVKEVWRVAKPLDKIVHTLGWPLRKRAKYREFGGSWIYPMGDDTVSLGFVVGLDYRDLELSAHDLLQQFKTHRFVHRGSPRRRAGRVGGQDDHERWLALTAGEAECPGAADRRRGRRPGQRPAPEGCPLRDRIGSPRSGGCIPGTSARRERRADRSARLLRRGASRRLRRAGAARGAQHASGVRQGVLRRWRSRKRDDGDKGKLPPSSFPAEPPAQAPLLRTGRARAYPARTVCSRSTSCPRFSSRATGRGTTSRITCGSSSGPARGR